MTLVQIGPSRVELGSWNDLLVAAREGLIDERTHCELKKGLPPSSQNVEVARDLASLTVEGGVLIYGVADAGGGRAGDVVGVTEPASAVTRLVGIADGIVQPSMVCDVRILASPTNSNRACVVVVVPPSSVAPHRADDRYWGRSAEGKRVLSDAEVAMLFHSRRQRLDGFLEHLEGLRRTLDPKPETLTSHIYFSAQPAQPTMANDPPWRGQHILHLLNSAGLPNAGWGGADLTSATHSRSHPYGVLGESHAATDTVDADRALRVLVRDSGAIDFVATFGSRDLEIEHGTIHAFQLSVTIILIDQCVRLTGHVARQLGSAGSWRLGARATDLRGLASVAAYSGMSISRAAHYPEEEFRQVIEVHASRLQSTPEAVVAELLAPLVRGFGVAAAFPYSHPQEMFRRNV